MDAPQIDEDRTLVGIDEVGIGCLAGPVVAAAVILDPANTISGITAVSYTHLTLPTNREV